MSVHILLEALLDIANHPSGGLIVNGTSEADRDFMIHRARGALRQFYDVPTWGAVLSLLDRKGRG